MMWVTAEDLRALEEIDAIVKRITYKPTYKLELEYIDDLFRPLPPVLRISYIALDAYADSDVVPECKIGRKVPLPPSLLTESREAWIVQWVWLQIQQSEIHEAAEWFKVDGTRLRDPHGR